MELFCLFWFVAQVCKQICDKNQETSKKVLIFHKNSNINNKFKNKINEKTKATPSYGEWYHLLGHHLVNTSIIMIEMRWEWEWDDYEN